MKRFIPRTIASLSTVVAAFALAGCGPKPGDAKQTATDLPSVEVRVQTVENKSRTMTEEVLGTVRAKLHATLEARVSGRIENLPVALGDKVAKGQLIARLDAAEIAARLEQADASFKQAELDWQRVSTLFAQQGATRAEYDAAQARESMAKAAVAEAKTMMGYVEIVAPFDGVVTKKWADVGDQAAPGKPLVDIEDPAALQLQADVPDALIGNVKLGDTLAVRVASASSDLTGTVAELSPVADPGSRTSVVKLDLRDAPGLRSGQFGRVAVAVGEVSAMRVLAASVIQRGQMELVFVVTNGRAQLRIVKTGSRVGDELEVVSGLNPGEQVVTEGAANLMDGQPVNVK